MVSKIFFFIVHPWLLLSCSIRVFGMQEDMVEELPFMLHYVHQACIVFLSHLFLACTLLFWILLSCLLLVTKFSFQYTMLKQWQVKLPWLYCQENFLPNPQHKGIHSMKDEGEDAGLQSSVGLYIQCSAEVTMGPCILGLLWGLAYWGLVVF